MAKVVVPERTPAMSIEARAVEQGVEEVQGLNAMFWYVPPIVKSEAVRGVKF
jgi:hypothetical protein